MNSFLKGYNMKVTRKHWLTLFMITFVLPFFSISSSFAQGFVVQNVHFQDNDKQIIIYYDLLGKENNQFEVRVILSSDGAKTFSIEPKTLSGAIGMVTAGAGKEIYWDMHNDYPEGLWGENFIFQIEATRIKTKKRGMWPYFVGGAAVLGGGAAYFLRSGGEEKKKDNKGTLIVTVPDMP